MTTTVFFMWTMSPKSCYKLILMFSFVAWKHKAELFIFFFYIFNDHWCWRVSLFGNFKLVSIDSCIVSWEISFVRPSVDLLSKNAFYYRSLFAVEKEKDLILYCDCSDLDCGFSKFLVGESEGRAWILKWNCSVICHKNKVSFHSILEWDTSY